MFPPSVLAKERQSHSAVDHGRLSDIEAAHKECLKHCVRYNQTFRCPEVLPVDSVTRLVRASVTSANVVLHWWRQCELVLGEFG